MKILCGLTIATLACLWSAPSFAAPACAGMLRVPKVTVRAAPVHTVVGNNLETAQLEAKSHTITGYAIALGWHTNGLATAKIQFGAEMTMSAKDGSDGSCLALNTLDVIAAYSGPIQIDIANRYRPGTCQYEAIRVHEMRHVAIYTNAISQHLNEIRAVVAGYTVKSLPVLGVDNEDARAKLSKIVDEATTRASTMVVDIARRENAAIDTPESYAEVQAQCPSW